MNHSTVRVSPAGTLSFPFRAVNGESVEPPSLTLVGLKALAISRMWPYRYCLPKVSWLFPQTQVCRSIDLFGVPTDSRLEALPLWVRVGPFVLPPLDFFPLPFTVVPAPEAIGSSKKELQEESSADSLDMWWAGRMQNHHHRIT